MAASGPTANSPSEENILEIPTTHLNRRTGFSLDIGGTLIKVAYTTKPDTEGTLRIHFACFPRNQLDQALAFVKDKLGDTLEKDTLVYTTGNGCHQFKDKITQTLNIRPENQPEDKCFLKAFFSLRKWLPDETISHAPSQVAALYAQDRIQTMMNMVAQARAKFDLGDTFKDLAPGVDTEEAPKATTKPDDAPTGNADATIDSEKASTDMPPAGGEAKFPCLLFMMGSGNAIMKVNADGTHNMLDMVTRCGATFLGLGRLLTGAKTFEELMALAAKGSTDDVNVLGKHIKTGQQDDIYGMAPDDVIAYCFGQAANRDPGEFSKEDLAATLLTTMAEDIAHTCYLTAVAHNIPRVYFSGSFVGLSDSIRVEISKFLNVKSVLTPFTSFHPQYWFLKHGAYYGALGGLLLLLTGTEQTTRP